MNPATGLERLVAGLDRLEIHYMVAGSAASSAHGIWRATGDVDIVARIDENSIKRLVEEFENDFYIDASQIESALRHRRAFNVIHFASSYKFDIFPLGPDKFQQLQFTRRAYTQASIFADHQIELCVASPEDVILSKLNWYSLGGKTSEQQWNDVLGVLAVQEGRLDYAYLREWAAYLGIGELLEEALRERHEPFS